MKTIDARKLSISAQETIRMKAVAAVIQGMKQVAAAQVCGVTRQAVGRWVKAYRQGGEAALKARKQGRPRGSGRLHGWQATTIITLMTDKDLRQLKLPFYLWT